MGTYHFFEWEPAGDFHFFSLEHILAVVLGLSAIVLACFFLRKMEHNTVRKILIGATITAMVCDVVYMSWEIYQTGALDPLGSLPLYYCSLFYMVLPFAIWAKSPKVRQCALAYLATFNLIAGLMGLIINTNLNVYPVFSFVGIRSLFYHFMMIFISTLLWFTRYYKPKITDTCTFIVPIMCMMLPAHFVNITFGSDYFYLNGGLGTPIEIVSSILPHIVYIIVLYATIVLLVNLIFYLPTIIRYFKDKKAETAIRAH